MTGIGNGVLMTHHRSVGSGSQGTSSSGDSPEFPRRRLGLGIGGGDILGDMVPGSIPSGLDDSLELRKVSGGSWRLYML